MTVSENEKARIILFCGLSNAGKTTILNIFTKGDVFKTAPTLGISLSTLSVKDMNFRIFDLAGQDKFREEITPLLPFADLIVFVIDSAEKGVINKVADEFKRILKNTSKKLTPICILRHKSDLKKTMSEKYLISKLGLKRTLDRNWNILSTSAVTLEGLTDLYSWIVNEAMGEIPEFTIEKKKEDEVEFHYPCPMMKDMKDGSTFCLNRNEFIETELMNFGFHDEVSKMVLEAIPDLKKQAEESSGRLLCPDFTILKNGENVLRCPVTNFQLEMRGFKVTLERYENAVILSKIYGQKIGEDICRECIYKILVSPDTILSEADIRKLQKSFR